MRLACIVLAHGLPGQLALLVRAMRHPQVHVYVHIDKRKSLAPFTDALAGLGTKFLSRHAASWGSSGCVDAALEGLQAGFDDRCDYFILISGQDFPIQPVQKIVAFCEQAGPRSYLEHWPVHESRHRFQGRDRTNFYSYTVRGRRELCIPRGEDTGFLDVKGRLLNEALRLRGLPKPRHRRFPNYARPFAGATWWNMSRPAADHVLSFCEKHPDYRLYHQHTMVPEEIFFQSILAGTDYAGEVVGDSLRFYRWDGIHAQILTAEDVPEMRASGKLFARKFDGVPAALLLQGPSSPPLLAAE